MSEVFLEQETSMVCVKCGETLGLCECPDMDERLAELSKMGHMTFRICLNCNKHYARHDCDRPLWGYSHNMQEWPEANELQRLVDEANKDGNR